MVITPGAPAFPSSPSLSPRNYSDDASGWYSLLGSNPVALIIACFTLDTLGQSSLIVLLATLLLSSNVRQRNATLINLLLVTVICSVPPALLFYSDQYLNPHPPSGLCIVQAILKHGTDPMFVVASLALVIEFLQGTGLVIVRFMTKQCLSPTVLVAAPYVTFVLHATVAAGLGGSQPHRVVHKENELYCSIDIAIFTRFQQAFMIVIVIATISLEAYTILKLRRTWDGVRRAKSSTLFTFSQALRITGFTILQLNYVILSSIDFYFSSVGTHILPVVYEALMPLGTFLIFGTTTDCLSAWICCWTRQKYASVAVDKPLAVVVRRPLSGASQVINIDFRLSLIPGFTTPSDFIPIDGDSLPSNRGTQRFTIVSSRSGVKTPSILRIGDGLSLASSGDQPRSIRLPPIETKSSSLLSAGSVTIASSAVRAPTSPQLRTLPSPRVPSTPQAVRVSSSPRVALPPPSPPADLPFFLSLSLPPSGLDFDF